MCATSLASFLATTCRCLSWQTDASGNGATGQSSSHVPLLVPLIPPSQAPCYGTLVRPFPFLSNVTMASLGIWSWQGYRAGSLVASCGQSHSCVELLPHGNSFLSREQAACAVYAGLVSLCSLLLLRLCCPFPSVVFFLIKCLCCYPNAPTTSDAGAAKQGCSFSKQRVVVMVFH